MSPIRENMTSQQVQAYLDTPGGLMLSAQYGSRQAAAAALVQDDALKRQWRRQVAAAKFENYPDVWPSVDDAMRAVPDPVGGFGAQLNGSTDEIVAKVRRIDPSRGVQNLGEAPQDGKPARALVYTPDGSTVLADTRPPWQRGE